MYLERKIDVELEIWKQLPIRKPLILRGARQVGKSTAVRNLAFKFKYFIEINFDEGSKEPFWVFNLLQTVKNLFYNSAIKKGYSPKSMLQPQLS